ncbi:MAG: methionyl-tRNA formyltransferase [Lachnospiraceae bacterium]|nr:methionyl-tRNA formyltransferase [Lachnospiraceae bacterium]
MKILFMGTPDFASYILEKLIKDKKHEVAAVVTQPDRPKGRSGEAVPSPVKVCATEYGIPVLQPMRVRDEGEAEALRSVGADIFVVAAFGQILPPEVLAIPPRGCINVHASLLPEYRGAAPIQWAIADGKAYTGVTIQRMNEGVDTGDIISSVKVPIAEDETGESLFEKLMHEGALLLAKTLDTIEKGEETYTPQDEAQATYARILKKEMGYVDFSKTAKETERLCRAFTPWPGTFTYLGGKLLKIKECHAGTGGGIPGTVVNVTKDEIVVACSEGALSITKVQSEGKKEMTVHDFLLGRSITAGERLGRDAEDESR